MTEYKRMLKKIRENPDDAALLLSAVLLEDNPQLFLKALDCLLDDISCDNKGLVFQDKNKEILEEIFEKLKEIGLCMSVQII